MRVGTTGLAGTTPLSRFTTWDYLSPSARLGLISSGYSGYGQELGKFTLLGCSASVSAFISPTTCSCNWSRQHSGTAARRKALPVLAADGQPNTCASALKPPGVPRSSWTCGPGA